MLIKRRKPKRPQFFDIFYKQSRIDSIFSTDLLFE